MRVYSHCFTRSDLVVSVRLWIEASQCSEEQLNFADLLLVERVRAEMHYFIPDQSDFVKLAYKDHSI
jgi:predicted XRE-type DNA-binding protein